MKIWTKWLLTVIAAAILLAANPRAASALCGDVSGDGYIRSNDVLMTARASLDVLPLSDAQKSRADVAIPPNAPDGKVLSNDLLMISRNSVGMIPTLNCVEGTTITGLVLAPEGVSLGRVSGRLAATPNNGLRGKSGVTVTIIMVNERGEQRGNEVAHGRTDENGNFSVDIPTNIDPDSIFVFVVGGGPNKMRAMIKSRGTRITRNVVDINPFSELVTQEIIANAQPLSTSYTDEQIAAMTAQVQTDATAASLDLSTATSISEAMTTLSNNSTLIANLEQSIHTASGNYCGDGTINGLETCDNGANNTNTACVSEYGTECFYCDTSCQPHTVIGAYCGDSVINGSEQCDGANLNGATCASRGFTDGTLSCSACSFNTTGCTTTIPQQHFVSKWGTTGSGNGQYNNPRGLAVDNSGNVYVVDQNNNRVDVTDANGAHIAYIGPAILGTTNLSVPEAVCVSKVDGTIAIVEEGVILLDSSHVFLRRFGGIGMGDGQFNEPKGCAFDLLNNIYVVDDTSTVGNTVNHRIEKFDINGNFLLKWGSKGTGDGQFNKPWGITVDSQNNIYVSESGGNRIQKFTSDGAFVAKWGCSGSGNGCFSLPSYMGSDSSNHIYVMDFGNNRVQVFTNTGTFLYSIGSLGSADGQFLAAVGITITSGGIVYVSDGSTAKNNVQKFTY
ncbi:MAG: hypothetical protein PHU42_01680 [Patescibacteria group bacterium]|nr:hypothetical protein [Patescibacteria group bacterium]